MKIDLEQWLLKPKTEDQLSNLSISEKSAKFPLPSILASNNNLNWLANSTQTQAKSQENLNNFDKWLYKPSKPTQNGKNDNDNPWLAKSVMATSLTSLPGTSTSFDSEIWLQKSPKNSVKNEYEDWLLVPKTATNSNQKNPLEKWQENSQNFCWISKQNKVEEWLKKALEETEENFEEDFDDLSIEIISNSTN